MIADWGGSADGWGRRFGARWLPVWMFLLGASFTACVYLLPGDMFDVAYRSVSLRVASEAFGSLAGLALAYLIVGRAREGPLLADYLIAAAFIVAAVENIAFLAFPTAHNYGYTSNFSAWSSSTARIAEAALFAGASFAPRRQLPISRRAALGCTVASAGVVCLAISVAVLAAGRHLPAAIDQSLSPVSPGTVLPAGSAGIALLTLTSAVLFAIAAARMSLGARANDPLGRWLAVGLVMATLAACNFALFPTEYSQWVDVGDILQFAFSLALVVGVASEVRQYWRRLVSAAVLEERRRIARDLHDGLAQELAFIVLEAGGASSAASPPETLRRIAAAAERATMEVRLVVAAFIEPLDSSVLPSLQKTAREAAKRYADLRIETTGADFDVSSVEREALHWITREAVSNAVRHGHAANVRLRVTSTPSRRLRVVDDGGGFDPATHGDGFGITIMSARAVRAGGSLSVRSLRGVGTAVQIVLPTLEPAKRARDRREPAGALPR